MLRGVMRGRAALNRTKCERLTGVYAAVSFFMAQVLNRVRFGQAPTVPIYAGGVLIVAGGLLMAFWKG